MEKFIQVGNQFYPVEYPNKCPICHHHGDIALLATFPQPKGVQVIFQCPFFECRRYFIGYYGPIAQKQLLAIRPQEPEPTQWPAVGEELSPKFVAIYREAEQARHTGLTQIAGPGYRKAFEFLLKDYAKSRAPEKAEEVDKAFSGNVVTEYISDPRIQAVAQRALWLGNDETHYLRKWTSHGVEDLITLIKLSINWIEIEHLSESYRQEMPSTAP